MSGTARLLVGIAAWTGAGILLGALWTWTVGGTPPVWVAVLLGATVWAAVAFGLVRLAFWRDTPRRTDRHA